MRGFITQYPRTDAEAWNAFPHDRWVYDRLRLADELGYLCGPAGTEPPRLGFRGDLSSIFWTKPIINLDGMGLGSQPYSAPVPPGHFWMRRFYGVHVSIDYVREKNRWNPVLSVCAKYDDRQRIATWSRMTDKGMLWPPPQFFERINSPVLNVEYIGGYVIEAHLRHNQDWHGLDDVKALRVVWADDEVPPNMIDAHEDCDGLLTVARLGFEVLS
jgi:hypothetical protein